ncbi:MULTISPECIES: ABC transporter permease [Phyllobacteriaceae]|uniref:ABC transporter permease n=1 Tax=Ollibium composti TaxID=2675109 RepID=A0ABY2Q630_9HYPH|nr:MULTISPECIES: ABC transporter permease [Mesorhizobium]QDC02459.1 ABC transporter permease [Mesorhizobium sp. 8]THF56444.1 ABC transporter permease [Mesorhizobium composti]
MAFAIEFFLRRISQGLVIVLLVAFVIFTLLRIVPGDPIRIILGPMTPASVLEQTAKDLGLRDPILVQFGRFVGQVATGDLGRSFIRGLQGGSAGGSQDAAGYNPESRASVAELIGTALPYSLQLAGLGILFALLVAVPIGMAAGLRAGKWPDRLGLYVSSLFVSLPNIWVAVVLIFLLSAKADLLPAIGYRGFSYTIIPAMVVAIELSPVMIRAISVSVAANLGEIYYDVGMVRGLSRWTMIFKHVLRNAAVPLLNLFGAQMIGMLLGGLFVVEYIFSYPGVGMLTINAVFQRDFPIIQAVAILASGALVAINMLVDFTSTTIDRRLKF